MITIDDGLKIVLIGAISFSIVLFTIYVVRLLNQVSEAVKDSRSVIKNVSTISDMVEKDIVSVRSKVANMGKSWGIINTVLGILGGAGASGIFSKMGKSKKAQSNEKNASE